MRRELRVDRQLWTPPTGGPILKTPKSTNSYRTIALSTVVQLAWLPAYPIWSIVMIVLDVLIIGALAATGDRALRAG